LAPFFGFGDYMTQIAKPQTPAELFKTFLSKANFVEIFALHIDEKASTGRDGTRVESFKVHLDAEIDVSIRKIFTGTYEFTSYKEKLISKGAESYPRQISIPTVRDKLVLKFLSELLAKIYPDHISKPPHQFIKQIHEVSSVSNDETRYLRLDIESYYPSINHSILMRILRRKIRQKNLLRLIENAIKTPTGKKKNIQNENRVGIPQGLSISNILSSIYLHDIDIECRTNPKVHYYRFVDDILLIGPETEITNLSKTLPIKMRRTRKIKCHEVGGASGKSAVVPASNGIDYLGYHFCKEQIEIRDSSYKKMFSNLMNMVTSMKYKGNKAPLIWRLNLRITGCKYKERRVGWLFFFAQTKNLQQIKQLDAFLVGQLKNILTTEQRLRIKTLTRAYYEIRYNFRASKYYPDFDNFDDEQMRAQIKVLLPYKKIDELNGMESKELKKLFNKCILKEIGSLEKDMLEVFS
jgi:RNA-directed DNA polymerase